MSDPLYLLDTNVLLLLVRGQDLGRHIDQRFGSASGCVSSGSEPSCASSPMGADAR
jgi:hypothetical protein